MIINSFHKAGCVKKETEGVSVVKNFDEIDQLAVDECKDCFLWVSRHGCKDCIQWKSKKCKKCLIKKIYSSILR